MTGQRDRVREGYDALAADYDARRSADPPATLDALLDRLAPGDRILDAGCGGGKPVLERLDAAPAVDGDGGGNAAGGYRAVGVDLSRSQLALARGRTDGPLVQGDVTALPFRADAFDAVASLHTIIHVPTADHPTVVEEFARVLRPGGWLLLTTGDEAWTGSNDDWLGSGARMEWSYPSADATRRTLRAGGFAIEAVWPAGDPSGGDFPFLLARSGGV